MQGHVHTDFQVNSVIENNCSRLQENRREERDIGGLYFYFPDLALLTLQDSYTLIWRNITVNAMIGEVITPSQKCHSLIKAHHF